mgnify:CR=1 FL=1
MSAEMSPAVGCITEITHFTPIGGYIINPSKYHHISFFNATNHSEIPIGDYFWDKNSLKSQRYLHKWGNIHNF